MGRIREYLKEAINKFWEASEPEKGVGDLALAGNMTPEQIKDLQRTQDGATDWKWAESGQKSYISNGRRDKLNNRIQAKGKQSDTKTRQSVAPKSKDDDLVL